MTAAKKLPASAGKRADIEAALADKYHVSYEYLTGVPTSQFDIDRSLKNQARFDAIDEPTVELHAEAVTRGDPFPAVVAWRPGRATLPKLVVIDGNHRLVAHDRVGAPINVYEVDRNTKPNIVMLMMYAFNTTHGRPTSEEERTQHAIYLINNGATLETAAQAMNVPARILRRALADAKADERAAEVGIDPREWGSLMKPTKARLLGIATDEGFAAATKLVFQGHLDTNETSELVALLSETRSGAKQKAFVKAQEAIYQDRIQGNNGGLNTRSNPRGSAATPKTRLNLALGQLLAVPDDMNAFAAYYGSSERDEQAQRIMDASLRLQKFARALDPAIR